MIEEGHFPDYSNSFIVLASPREGWQDTMNLPLYAKYGNDRMDRYRVCTVIDRNTNGVKRVFKLALSTHANPHVDSLNENYERLTEQFANTGLVPVKCYLQKGRERGVALAGVAPKAKDSVRFDYVSGITLEDYLNLLESDGQYEKMEQIIQEYCRKLNSSADVTAFCHSAGFDEVFGKRDFKKKYVALSPCNFDMIFSNIVFDENDMEKGKWTVLDYEWVWDFPIPIQFVIYRALYYHFRNRSDDGFAAYLAKKGTDVYSLCKIDIGERMLFNEMEHSFQVYIIGGAASLEVMQVLMPSTTIRIDNIVRMGSYLRNLDTPRIYYSRGSSFSPDNQINVIANVDNGHVFLAVPFERYINSLRIDPTEYPCLLHIEGLRYILDDGFKQDAGEVIVNGYKLSENTFVFDTVDAQIIIEGIPQNARSLEIEYHITMIENPFYEDILNILKRDVAERLKEKQAISYRIKRKAGIIREDTLPEGYVRANPQDSKSVGS